MKVLLFIDTLGRGGAQRQVANLAIGLKSLGHQVGILTYYPTKGGFATQLDDAGVPIDLIQKKSRFDLNISSYLKKKVEREEIDVVISFMRTPNVYLELVAKSLKNTKVFVSERSSDLALNKTAGIKLRSLLHQRADKIISNSFEYARLIGDRFPKLKPKVIAIPNGLSAESFIEREYDLSSEREDDRPLQFLAVSNIHFYKNYSKLIEAMGILSNSQLKRIKVVWAGRFPEKEDEKLLFDEAKARIALLGLGEHFTFVGEIEDVSDHYRKADVFIHPSNIEGMSNSICEALAAGLPLLVSRVADYEWLLDKGNNGFSFDPTSEEDIARSIVEVINLSKGERQALGRSGQKFAKKNLSQDSLAMAYHELIIS